MEVRYPRLKREQVFRGIEAFMVICDPDEDALYLSGTTWIIRTPENPDFGAMTIYFTYAPGQICLESLTADDEEL